MNPRVVPPEALARRYDPGTLGFLTTAELADIEWADPVWHLYVVRHPQRDALQAALSDAGVGTLIHYPIPPHRQQAYADAGFGENNFPLAARMANEVLSLPMGPHLAGDQQARVVEAVASFPG